MPTIELWDRAGKGVIRFVHNMTRKLRIFALEDLHGNIYPIYEGHDVVPTGIYGIVILNPYPKEGEKPMEKLTYPQIEARNEDDIVYVVHESELIGGYRSIKQQQWDSYVAKHGEKLQRPLGWSMSSAESMLMYMRSNS